MTTLFSITGEDNDLINVDTGFWAVSTYGGSMEVSAAAALVGSYGFAITPLVGYKESGVRQFPRTKRFRIAFYMARNTFVIADGEYVTFLCDLGMHHMFVLRFHRVGSTYYVQPVIYKEGGQSNGNQYAIDTASHLYEIDVMAASAPGANDGYLSMWVDGTPFSTGLSSIDNDTCFAMCICVGLLYNAPAGTSGTMYIDHIRANNDGSEIGA